MKYKVGDKVRIVKEKKGAGWNSDGLMDEWLGKVMTIESVHFHHYKMEEDKGQWYWFEGMIEGEATEMTKSDLIAGKHVVETRNGRRFLIFDSKVGKFMFETNGEFMLLESYDEYLMMIDEDEDFDIMKIYEFKNPASKFSMQKYSEQCLTLVWERTEPKEMTMAEIEKELGYKVKIVKEHE